MSRNRVFEIMEWGAVGANLLYTFLYIQGSYTCFIWGIIGPLLLLGLCIDRKIYADAVLQLVYVALAIYGWLNWGTAGWSSKTYSALDHALLILLALVGGGLLGFFLKKYSDAQLPFIDSLITTGFLVATWLMMNFVHENWLYFIVLNAASIALYANRRLYKASLMFVLYLFMSIDAYWQLGIFMV